MKKLSAPLLIACAMVVAVAVYLHAQVRADNQFDAARKALNAGSYDSSRSCSAARPIRAPSRCARASTSIMDSTPMP
jgi:hypothetical protein